MGIDTGPLNSESDTLPPGHRASPNELVHGSFFAYATIMVYCRMPNVKTKFLIPTF